MLRCLFVCLLILGNGAQSTLAQNPASPEAAPERIPFEKAIRAYRSGPVAESVQIRVKDDQGRERRADILVRIDAFGADGVGPLRARIELGDLAVSIEGNRLLATHRLEKNRFAEFTLANKPLLEALEDVMPALVLPQLVFADRNADRMEDLGVLPRRASVLWQPGSVDRPTGKLMFAGTSGDTTFRMLVDRSSGRLASLQIASTSGPIRNIDLTARSVPPGLPETWPIETEGRKRVDSLADLVSESDQVRIGERFPPTMSILTTGLAPWQEVRDDLASVFVFIRPDTDELEADDVKVRDEAVANLRQETSDANRLVQRLKADSEGRWVARTVAILPPKALRFEVTSILLSVLNPTESAVLSLPDNLPLIAVAQSFDYDPILGGGVGGVVVVDKNRIVRAMITLGEVESTEKKVRRVLESLK